jgi:hypothetical protein
MQNLSTEIEKTLSLSERLKEAVLEQLVWGHTVRMLTKLPRTPQNTVLINRLLSQSTR